MTEQGLVHCRWWQRWIHRRKRRADRDTILPAIRDTTAAQRPWVDRYQRRRALWEQFLAEPGQEHWHCECGIDDRIVVLHELNF